jgi:hypothetical protein
MQPKESKTYWHFYCSMSKSILRVGAGYFLIENNLIGAGWLLIIAEVLGIIEEL